MDVKKRKICIVGGGNIGTLLYSDLLLNKHIDVSLYTSKPNLWGNTIKVYNSNDVLLYEVTCGIISDKVSEVISNADIIIITIPSSGYSDFYLKIKDFIKPVYGELIGIHKLSNGFYKQLCNYYSEIRESNPNMGYEFVLMKLSQSVTPLSVLKAENLKWYEIDDEADLEYAEENVIQYIDSIN